MSLPHSPGEAPPTRWPTLVSPFPLSVLCSERIGGKPIHLAQSPQGVHGECSGRLSCWCHYGGFRGLFPVLRRVHHGGKVPDPGRGRRKGMRTLKWVGSLGLGEAKRCWEAAPLPLIPFHCTPSTPQRSQQFNCPLMDLTTRRSPRPQVGKTASCTRSAGLGKAGREPDSYSIMQVEMPRLRCSGNKSFNIYQGPGRDPRPLESLAWTSASFVGSRVSLRGTLTPGQVCLGFTLPFQGSQPPWVHPLRSLTPQGKQMVLGLQRTGCPRAQLSRRCDRGRRNEG